MSPRPPRVSEALMRRSLPAGDRETVLGDLAEEFAARAAADGLRQARSWYRRQVRRSLGANVARRLADRAPAARPLALGAWLRDLHDAVRSLRGTPGFTLVALAVLTLGIGATTAIYSVVDAVALRPLPYPDDDRLVTVLVSSARGPEASVDPRDLVDWRAQQSVFEDLAASASPSTPDFISRSGGLQERLSVLRVTAGLFSTLRAAPALGGTFSAASEVDGNDRVVVLSDGFWRRHFDADPHAVGRTLTLDNGDWVVAGVMPAGFMYPVESHIDLWVPYVVPASEKIRGNDHDNYLTVIARMKPGVTIASAQQQMTAIASGLVAAYPAWYAPNRNRPIVTPMIDTVVGADVRAWMLMLLGAVACVLLIACVNVANLMLARATTRGQELGVRAALGATRWQLARSVLIESLVLSLAGAGLGVVAAWWGVSALHAALPPHVPRAAGIGIDLRVLSMAALASIVTGVGFGLGPAIAGARRDVSSMLRDGGRAATASAPRQRIRTSLVVSEVSLAVVLLVGAGLFIASFARLVATPVGVDYAGVTSVAVSPPTAGGNAETRALAADQAMHEMRDRVQQLHGVVSACVFSGALPFSGNYHRTGFTPSGGRSFNGRDDGPDVYFVSAEYFDVLRLPRIAGRTFTGADDRRDAQPTAVVNALAASLYFDGRDPIGQVGRVGTGGLSSTDLTIVGVVGNMKPLGPDTPPRPEIYVPIALSNVTFGYVLARTSGESSATPASMASAVSAVSPSMVVPEPQALESLFATRIAQRRFNMVLLVLFGALALAIASTGIYGVIAYIVSQRTKEIGVRMALGAAPSGVIGMVLGHVLALVGVGLSVGLVLAWLLSGSLRAFLFEIGPHEPIVYALVPLALVVAGLAAAIGPARRAARVDLVATLRGE